MSGSRGRVHACTITAFSCRCRLEIDGDGLRFYSCGDEKCTAERAVATELFAHAWDLPAGVVLHEVDPG